MSIFDVNNATFLYAQELAAELGGQIFAIGRPDYTQVDNTPVIIVPRIRIKAEKTRGVLAQPEYKGIEHYAVFGLRAAWQAGDLLIPQDSGSDTPTMTIMSESPIEECVAFRSDSTASIINGDIGNVFTNVPYANLGQGYPGAEFNREVEASLQIPSKKFVLFARDLASSDPAGLRDVEGLIFEENNAEMKRWEISQAEATGHIMVLTCKQAKIQ